MGVVHGGHGRREMPRRAVKGGGVTPRQRRALAGAARGRRANIPGDSAVGPGKMRREKCRAQRAETFPRPENHFLTAEKSRRRLSEKSQETYAAGQTTRLGRPDRPDPTRGAARGRARPGRARPLGSLAVRTRRGLCPRMASPPPSHGCARSRACGVLDLADHGPGRERELVARGERDLDDAVGPDLDHEHAAADRAIGERDNDGGEAGPQRGGGDDLCGGHGVTRSSA